MLLPRVASILRNRDEGINNKRKKAGDDADDKTIQRGSAAYHWHDDRIADYQTGSQAKARQKRLCDFGIRHCFWECWKEMRSCA